jgi:hypothetical protein
MINEAQILKSRFWKVKYKKYRVKNTEKLIRFYSAVVKIKID